MSEPPPLSAPGPRPSGVHTRRCVRHVQREAAARCVVCSGFFCRECVVDHGGRLLCASCLAKAGVREAKATAGGLHLRRLFSLGAAVLVAWLAFYWTGELLLKLPPDLHATEKWEPPRTEEEP